MCDPSRLNREKKKEEHVSSHVRFLSMSRDWQVHRGGDAGGRPKVSQGTGRGRQRIQCHASGSFVLLARKRSSDRTAMALIIRTITVDEDGRRQWPSVSQMFRARRRWELMARTPLEGNPRAKAYHRQVFPDRRGTSWARGGVGFVRGVDESRSWSGCRCLDSAPQLWAAAGSPSPTRQLLSYVYPRLRRGRYRY